MLQKYFSSDFASKCLTQKAYYKNIYEQPFANVH